MKTRIANLSVVKSNHSPFTKTIFSAYLRKPIDFFKGGLKTMDQCTHEVRAEYWKKIIQACGQRPAGQSAKSWMDENGICEQSYYHWQRRFRKQAYEEMKGNSSVPAVTEKTELSLLKFHATLLRKQIHTWFPINRLQRSGRQHYRLIFPMKSPDALLARIIREVSHA